MDLLTMVLACNLYSNNSIVNAMVELNSNNNPLVISGQPYKTEQQALNAVNQLKAQGTPFQIGLMQIPDSLLKDNPASMHELLRPCKNMIVATQILSQLQDACNGSTECALSTYKTGDATSGLDYANQVIQYANDHPVTPPPPLE